MTRSSSPKPRPSRSGRAPWLQGAPAWISAGAAVTGTILAVIVAFGLVNPPRPTEPPAPSDAPADLEPHVTLDSVLVGSEEVAGDGAFENVDPTIMEVLFVGRPAGLPDERWVAVSASLAPAVLNGSLASGRWSASRPAPLTNPHQWRAIVWPLAPGAAGDEDLMINGPNSQYVIAVSEERAAQ